MLLTIDIGNTNIAIGVFREDELIAHWRTIIRIILVLVIRQ